MTEEKIKKTIEERQKELERVSTELVRVRDYAGNLSAQAQRLQGAIGALQALIEPLETGES